MSRRDPCRSHGVLEDALIGAATTLATGLGSSCSVPPRPGPGGGDQEEQEAGGQASPRAEISKAGTVEEGRTGGLGGAESVPIRPG